MSDLQFENTIILGDCLEKLKEFPDNCIDAVVTDPPYGLSKHTEKDIRTCLKAWLNDEEYLHGAIRKGRKNCANVLCGIDSINNSYCVDSKGFEELVSFPVFFGGFSVLRPIKLNNKGFCWEVEVNSDSPPRNFEDLLVDDGYSYLIKLFKNPQLFFRMSKSFPCCVGSCSHLAQTTQGSPCILVRIDDSSFRKTQSPSDIMALRRTEIIIIFAFDSARRSFKWFVADCTSKCDTFLELGFAQDIRALFRTGCLSSVFEPSDVGCVGVATDNTNSLNKVVGFSSTSPCTGIRTTSDSIFGGVEKITTNNTIFLHKNLLERLTCPIKYNKGMMGKQWDSFVPGPEIWKEVYRVLKPGGHMLVFAGTRSMDLMCMALRLAGFELRDSIGYAHSDEDCSNEAPLLAWISGQGFPKSLNVSKEIDRRLGTKGEIVGQRQDILKKQGADIRRGARKIVESLNAGAPERNNGFKTISADIVAPATAEAKQWTGYGSALKPSWEPIILARKPLEGTIAENILKHGVGGINIAACRVGSEELSYVSDMSRMQKWQKDQGAKKYTDGFKSGALPKTVNGRFPANVILSHHPECKFIGYKEVKSNVAFPKTVIRDRKEGVLNKFTDEHKEERIEVGENGVEIVEEWECHEDCPIKMFPESKGQQGDIKGTEPSNRIKNVYQEYSKRAPSEKRDDSGSAARFFKRCSFTEEDLCTNVNIVGNYSLLSKKVEDFVLRLVAIEDNQEDNLLKSMIQPFMNAMRKALKENCEINIKQMTFLGKKLWQDQKHIIMDLWKESPVNVVEIQKRINTTMIIQNLLSIDGFVENVISNIMLNNMVLGEAACRFKYEAKASQSDREEGLEDLPMHTAGECTGGRKEGSAGLNSPRAGAGRSSGHANSHPTVKPCSLIRYLCKLITPPNGIILDPFLGSGSTAKAAVLEGFRYVGIEQDATYVEISRKRVAYAKDVLLPKQVQGESKKVIRTKKADLPLQQNSSPSIFDL